MIIQTVQPSDGSNNVAVNTVITIQFSIQIPEDQILTRFITLLKGQTPVQTTIQKNGQTVFVTPAQLEPSTEYTLYVYNRNVITKEYLRGQDGTTLDKTYVVKFTTGTEQSDTPQYETPIFSTPITITTNAVLTDAGEFVLYTENPSIILTFSDEPINCSATQTMETLDGNITQLQPAVQFMNNTLAVNITGVVPNQLITIVLRNIQFKHSATTPELVVYKYTWLKPSFGTLHSIRINFGRFANYLKDYELVGNILKQQQMYEKMTGAVILNSDQISSDQKHAILLLAKYAVLEDMLLEKGYKERDSVTYTDMTVTFGTLNSDLLDYLKGQKEELERELAQNKLSPDFATQGLLSENWVKSVRSADYKKGGSARWRL